MALGSWGLSTTEDLPAEATVLLERSGWRERFDDRTAFWGQLDGHPISSTGSEAWGLVAAHMLPIPVHVRLGKQGAVSNADMITVTFGGSCTR